MDRPLFFCAVLLLLSACGGGGNDSPSPPPIPPSGGVVLPAPTPSFDKVVLGAWQGTASAPTANLISLAMVGEAGRFFLLYGQPNDEIKSLVAGSPPWRGFKAVDGLVQGTLTVNGGVVKATDLREFTSTGAIYEKLTLEGTYNASALNATLTRENSTSVVATRPAPVASYLYGVTPKLSEVEGTWTGSELVLSRSTTGTIKRQPDVGQKGNIEMTIGATCRVSGEVIPRSLSLASENLFDANLTFDAGCDSRSNKKFAGIVINQKIASVASTPPTIQSQLIIMAVTDDRSHGFVFSAQAKVNN